MSIKPFPKHLTNPIIDDRVKCKAEQEHTEQYPIMCIVIARVLSMVYEFEDTIICIQLENSVRSNKNNKY